MTFGMHLLGFSSAVGAAAGASALVRQSADKFSDVISELIASQDASESAADSAGTLPESNSTSGLGSSPTAVLDAIESALAGHLQRAGVPAEQAMKLEIHADGSLTVHADINQRATIQESVESDGPLLANLQQVAGQARAIGLMDDASDSHFVHYPASSAHVQAANRLSA